MEFALGLGGRDGARGHLLRSHEGEEADQDRGDLPGRVERARVEVRDGEAEARRRLEAARGRVHPDRGRRERVVGREDERSPVLAAMVRAVFGARDDVVPPVDGEAVSASRRAAELAWPRGHHVHAGRRYHGQEQQHTLGYSTLRDVP